MNKKKTGKDEFGSSSFRRFRNQKYFVNGDDDINRQVFLFNFQTYKIMQF